MSANFPIEPTRDPDTGVPYCSSSECGGYDGKRCRVLGRQPTPICEPAVAEMAKVVTAARLVRKAFGEWQGVETLAAAVVRMDKEMGDG